MLLQPGGWMEVGVKSPIEISEHFQLVIYLPVHILQLVEYAETDVEFIKWVFVEVGWLDDGRREQYIA